MTKSRQANVLIVVMLALGSGILLIAGTHWQCADPTRFICYFILSVLSSGMKVTLPSITGTMSVAFIFTLLGIEELSLSEALLITATATLVQCTWRVKKRPTPIQILFNVASISIATYLCSGVYSSLWIKALGIALPLRLLLTASTYFLVNTYPVAAVIGLTEGKPLSRVWKACYSWSFPYYLVGAAIAGSFSAANRVLGWEVTILGLPVVFLIYRSYRLYLGRLEDQTKHAENQKHHAEDMASLHLRTIETLALAIEAKDHTTHDHLERVQVYAVEIGKEMGLVGVELDALRAAALLHDIGKLAVPEHIISKPGKLTVEEFEKMKIHPVVGAEILERVQFPYPVAPIVRAHHEKWNGKGYPYGLRGEQIPIGARILAVVDCLDALATDRQYRRALPLDEAMEVIVRESGQSYEPAVVEILRRRYRELEVMAKVQGGDKARLSLDLKIENGKAPAAGFESSATASYPGNPDMQPADFLHTIAIARYEVNALLEMSRDLGNSLSLNETLSVLAVKLKRIIPHDAIAVYVRRDDKLIPEYVSGDDFRLFSSLEIPVGQGLSGWVAENRKSIMNGNPSVEPGYLNDPGRFSMLRSALAVPLEGIDNVVGVLTLYRVEKDAFATDQLRILMALTSQLALSIENALKYQQASSSVATDYLTGLPNAKSLFLHLDGEIARCTRRHEPLAVLACDLDGFKQVNDRFGHREGDKILQRIASGLKENCREYDYVARMGGDQFVLVLPGLTSPSLEGKIAELSRMVTQAGQAVCYDDTLSLTVGAAFYDEDGLDAEQLLAEADRRMYKEKDNQQRRIGMPAGLLALERMTTMVALTTERVF